VHIVNGITSTAGFNTITSNIIHDLTIGSAGAYETNAATVGGIVLTGSSVKTVEGNRIYNLRNTRTNYTGHIYGIYFTGATGTNNGIYRNHIYALEAPNNLSTAAANIYGVRVISNGIVTVANNVVLMGGNNRTAILYGLYDNGSSGRTNIYHNTIYVSGNAVTGTAASYAMFSNQATAIQNYQNNIFVNQRLGGTGTHFAIRLASRTYLTIDFNTYFVSNSGVLGAIGTTNYNNIISWRNATFGDFSSLPTSPQFINPGSFDANDYTPLDTNLIGTPYLGINNDFLNGSRVYFTQGAFDTYTNNKIVTVNSSLGLSTGTYIDLTQAFNSINDGTHQGTISVAVNSTHSLIQPAVLNRNGTGNANYTNISVYPSIPDIVIGGNLDGPLVDLNGARNVVFDGKVNGVSTNAPFDMIFRNVSISNVLGTSTIRLINSASNNVFQNLQIEGGSNATNG
jgi:hypothetical protein